jgi:hypothetical protein
MQHTKYWGNNGSQDELSSWLPGLRLYLGSGDRQSSVGLCSCFHGRPQAQSHNPSSHLPNLVMLSANPEPSPWGPSRHQQENLLHLRCCHNLRLKAWNFILAQFNSSSLPAAKSHWELIRNLTISLNYFLKHLVEVFWYPSAPAPSPDLAQQGGGQSMGLSRA